jgi:hypothetical protein
MQSSSSSSPLQPAVCVRPCLVLDLRHQPVSRCKEIALPGKLLLIAESMISFSFLPLLV